MTMTPTRQRVAGVADLVDPGELRAHTGADPIVDLIEVSLTFGDGARVALKGRGRELVSFMLEALDSGLNIVVEAEDELLTPQAAADVLGVTRQSVYRWQDEDLLPVVMKGRSRAVPSAAVRALKVARDSRQVAERATELAQQAAEVTDPGSGAAQAALLDAVRQAVRSGKPGAAGAAWKLARAEQVAAAATHAAEVFAVDQAD